MTDRKAYTDGLRQLADALDAYPEIPLPYEGNISELLLMIFGENAKEKLAAAARALPCSLEKRGDEKYFNLYGSLSGLKIRLLTFRDEVCERVVTGTRVIVEEVPDPEALAAVPTVKHTRIVEDVEWVCRLLLADEPLAGVSL